MSASPALYEHCEKVYKAMEDIAEQAPEGLIYSGHLTKLFEELHLGIPYYTAVMNKLKAMDCVRQIKRGGGPKPSKWLLLRSPSQELYGMPDGYAQMSKGNSAKQIQQQNRDLNARLTRLEIWAKTQGAPI
jgi:hypothetical protein